MNRSTYLKESIPILSFVRYFTGAHTRCFVSAVFRAIWRLFTGVRAWCCVCAVSFATWRLFTGCELGLFCVRCPWPLGA